MNIYKEKVGDTFREAVPKHFLFKIQAFSLLSMNSIEKYESNEFEAGGYKWSLSLYPDGNKAENGDGHVSLYLVLEDTNSLPAVWDLNVYFRLFLFDQIKQKYLIREDVVGRASYFHEMQKVHGFPQFVSLAKFKDPSNGYLVDDTCVFGAEVFVSVTHTWRIEDFSKILTKARMETITTQKMCTNIRSKKGKPTKRREEFSNIKKENLYLEKFKAGDRVWDVFIYPAGVSTGKENSMSLFLNLADCVEKPGQKVCVNYKLRVKNQINDNHIEKSIEKQWFHASCSNMGWPQFIGLSEMNDKGKGFLVNDTCIVEAEVQVLDIATKLP